MATAAGAGGVGGPTRPTVRRSMPGTLCWLGAGKQGGIWGGPLLLMFSFESFPHESRGSQNGQKRKGRKKTRKIREGRGTPVSSLSL